MSKALEHLKEERKGLLLTVRTRECETLDKLNEAIVELEAIEARIKELETPNTCGGCYWRGDNYCDHICGICLRNDEIRDMHEPKDSK